MAFQATANKKTPSEIHFKSDVNKINSFHISYMNLIIVYINNKAYYKIIKSKFKTILSHHIIAVSHTDKHLQIFNIYKRN